MTVLSTSVHSRTALICRAFSWVVTSSDVSIIVIFIVIISVVVSADIVVVVLTLDWDVFKSFDVTVTEAEISDSCHNLCPEEDDVLMTNFVSSVVVDDVSDDSPNFHLVILSRSPFRRAAACWSSVMNRLLIVMCDITLFESLVSSSWNATRQVILDECCGCRRQLSSTKKKNFYARCHVELVRRLITLNKYFLVTQRCSFAILWTLLARSSSELIIISSVLIVDPGHISAKKKLWTVSLFFFSMRYI